MKDRARCRRVAIVLLGTPSRAAHSFRVTPAKVGQKALACYSDSASPARLPRFRGRLLAWVITAPLASSPHKQSARESRGRSADGKAFTTPPLTDRRPLSPL